MITATLKLRINALDCFLYMDKLIILNKENEVLYIDTYKFYARYLSKYDESGLIKALFIDNKLLYNDTRVKSILNDEAKFKKLFNQISELKIGIDLNIDDLVKVENLGDLYVLDFIVYAKKFIFASKSGVYESNLNIHNGTLEQSKKTERVHDVRAKSIITKIGEVLVVSNYEGVFRGSLWKGYNRLTISEKPVIPNAQRINWMKENVLSFLSDNDYNYTLYENQIEEVKEVMPGMNFEWDESGSKSKKIKKFGIHKYSLSKLMEDINGNEQVIYAYNSNNFIFLVNESGLVRAVKLDEFIELDKTHIITDSLDIQKVGKPLSAHMIGKAVVFEFFEQIVVLQNGILETIEETDVYQIKGFNNSKNYQNILAYVSEGYVNITTVNPI